MELSDTTKRIILAILFVLIAGLMAYGLYFFFFRAIVSGPVSGPSDGTGVPGGLPEAGTGGATVGEIGAGGTLPGEAERPAEEPARAVSPVAAGGLTETAQLSDKTALGATGAGNDVQFYSREDGKFYRLDKDGNAQALSDKAFLNVSEVTWSPEKQKAVLEYPDGANIIYDFSSGQQITLPQHWEDFSFSPDGRELALKSLGLDPNNRWLAVASADGTQVKRVELLGEYADTVYPSWGGNRQIVAMYTRGLDFDRQEVFFLGQNDENFRSMVVDGRDFRHQWSPDGRQLLYSVYSSKTGMKPNLWIVNASGDEIGSGRTNLNLETWADKCAYAGATVYCAVPETMPEAAGLFPELAAQYKDLLYEINPATGVKKLVAVPDGNYSIQDPIVSENGYYLYFTEATTGRLNKIKLK